MAAVQVRAERKCHGHDLVHSRVKEHGPEKHAPDARLRGHPARTGWPLAVSKARTGRAGFFMADRESGGGISGWRIGSCLSNVV
jgi:hypothetical protein